jgi:hypothetical protein
MSRDTLRADGAVLPRTTAPVVRPERTSPKRHGMNVSAYCVRAEYVDLDNPRGAVVVELRNAEVKYRDRNHEYGRVVDIQVHGWDDSNGDPPCTDWIQLYAPEAWMHAGMMTLQGFLHIVRLDGKNLDPNFGSPDAPMRMAKLWLRPEAALDDDGEWLKDRRP